MVDVAALKAAGIHWPKTYPSWKWLYAHREERGLAGAFVKVGRRVLVDTEKFIAALKENAAE